MKCECICEFAAVFSYEVSRSYDGDFEDSFILGYDAVSSRYSLQVATDFGGKYLFPLSML